MTRPCPLCASTETELDNEDSPDSNYVACRNCGCRSGYHSTPEKAVAAWDSRPLDGDPLFDFKENQWWVKELEAAAVTDEQKRAVAVVHNLLRGLAREGTYHAELHRVGHALGLPAGSDVTKEIVPRIEALVGVNSGNLREGERYNWRGQNERLIYLGRKFYPGNGFWFQFAKVEEPEKVWSEVRAGDLASFERTVEVIGDNRA